MRYMDPTDYSEGSPGLTAADALKMPKWQQLNQQISDCRACPRLISHCQKIATEKRRSYRDWDYWGKPVPNFGQAPAPLLIVGLAPGAHGANRTGRMFTGDRSGDWLYRAMHRCGFANQPTSHSITDGLELIDCSITAVCHCAPPDNRPSAKEIANCGNWFEQTIEVCKPRVYLALGQVAWQAMIRFCAARQWLTDSRRPKFSHAAQCEITDQRYLLGSYHPSQQNTFTGRLTEQMLDRVFENARQLIDEP